MACHLFPVVMTSTPRHASNNLPQPVEITILMVWLINTTYFLRILKKIELDPASNLSVDNFKKILTTLMGQHLSLRYSQVTLVTGYSVLTAVNLSQHECAISGCTWAPN